MKAIALVVVCEDEAYAYAPDHVDVRIVELDLDWKGKLPAGVGFEELVAEAGVERYVEFYNDAE